ncbi:hypothetical protein TURU_061327 [Turdus rufiventris]|nr:hypothetical protein TURU_061327 [Turdus rufiventris]
MMRRKKYKACERISVIFACHEPNPKLFLKVFLLESIYDEVIDVPQSTKEDSQCRANAQLITQQGREKTSEFSMADVQVSPHPHNHGVNIGKPVREKRNCYQKHYSFCPQKPTSNKKQCQYDSLSDCVIHFVLLASLDIQWRQQGDDGAKDIFSISDLTGETPTSSTS